ncbi:MAG: DNA-deoxyinosine glycosylase [Lachnospiraceae bacterium]|nr:DNA-deoxyinosine glycosylase [Lachnospiraceae bacterium]
MVKNVWQHLTHGFGPLYDGDSRILILGSFPSVKSRAQAFFYGHPQNRFWRIIAALYEEPVPAADASEETLSAKRALILRHHLALYDVIEECDILGSSDSSIKNVVPADLRPILQGSSVRRIYVNGKTAGKYYDKYLEPVTGIKATILPSSSPANAAWSLERLTEAWRRALFE